MIICLKNTSTQRFLSIKIYAIINCFIWLLLKHKYQKKFIVPIGCHEHLPEVVQEMFLESEKKSENLNQKALKLQLESIERISRPAKRKHTLLWKKHGHQHSADTFAKKIFIPFYDTGLFLYSLKYIKKPRGFLMFSGGMARKQCHDLRIF